MMILAASKAARQHLSTQNLSLSIVIKEVVRVNFSSLSLANLQPRHLFKKKD